MTIDEIFTRYIKGTEQDKAEVREFITRHENMHMLYSKEFLNAAIRNAETLGIRRMTPEEAEAYDAALEADHRCPCCGQHIEEE